MELARRPPVDPAFRARPSGCRRPGRSRLKHLRNRPASILSTLCPRQPGASGNPGRPERGSPTPPETVEFTQFHAPGAFPEPGCGAWKPPGNPAASASVTVILQTRLPDSFHPPMPLRSATPRIRGVSGGGSVFVTHDVADRPDGGDSPGTNMNRGDRHAEGLPPLDLCRPMPDKGLFGRRAFAGDRRPAARARSLDDIARAGPERRRSRLPPGPGGPEGEGASAEGVVGAEEDDARAVEGCGGEAG